MTIVVVAASHPDIRPSKSAECDGSEWWWTFCVKTFHRFSDKIKGPGFVLIMRQHGELICRRHIPNVERFELFQLRDAFE